MLNSNRCCQSLKFLRSNSRKNGLKIRLIVKQRVQKNRSNTPNTCKPKNLLHKVYKGKWSTFYIAATWQAKDAIHSNCHSHLNKATSRQIMSTVQICRRLFQTVTTLTATYYRTKHKYRLMSSSYINLSLIFSCIRLFSTS